MKESDQIITLLNSDSEHMAHIANFVRNDLAHELIHIASQLSIKELDTIFCYIRQNNPDAYAKARFAVPVKK